jgi:alpha-galactosidase
MSVAVPVLLIGSSLRAWGQEVKFGRCYAQWSATELVVGNEHIERRWSIEGGLLRAVSLCDRDTHAEWLNKPAKTENGVPGTLTVKAQGGVFSPVEAPSLEVEVLNGAAVQYRMQIFEKARGVEIDVQPGKPVPAVEAQGKTDAGGASIVERESQDRPAEKQIDTPDELSLAPQHLRITQVSFSADTDHHNQLVFPREWMVMNNESDLMLRGNLFFAEDVVTGSGLIFLKQAALPEARAVQTGADLRVVSNTRTFRFLSQGFASVVLAYKGGRAGRIEALQTYQRQLRQYVPGRDGVLLTNTWGDRKRDAIDAGFVAKDIAADRKLGADVMEIDDGWQIGRSMNSARGPGVANGFQSTPTPFWDVDATRFPNGLEPLLKQCAAGHMGIGLWYAPDSSHEFANWQKDADQILEFYHRQGIANFKFDSINMTSQKAEDNLHSMFDRILVESNGAVTIDLDVTGTGRRPGYFGLMESGPIFVENRYTDFHRYWPHLTLRNLWELSEYVDPLRLRMEFLNNTRNEARYANDPLAPAKYTPDALFATVMMANPLGWFDSSDLPEKYIAAVAPLVKTWKRERDAMHRGTLIPIGDAPDGVSWTGFATAGTKPDASYALVFRELNAEADWSVKLPMSQGGSPRVTLLAGSGTAKVERGKLIVHIPEALQYVWVRLD